ncbi:uncharacterized protein LOC111888467 isoform X1 [Lactuca sativa]|uniref:Uncharacterized protein n=1 Tax=Lactuca sativa TaxID=4236 RepID=A0A9R1W8P1_LACSA|nr:uncharacterized protein LOC111888467 isoform X1 [Lactuca sativa]XP_023740407.1 uncharacterized protein LOC111888467 isoform X1 [Lactuca sativa]KAJ0220606.1 hypothetical protein LSAT_V11C200099410 [Lactuca sativa]
MDLELLNHINVDLKWNILKKGRRSMARRPRKTGADTFELGNKKQDPTAFETKKVADTPLKRRRLVHESPSTPPQISCLHGNGVLPPGPQTPCVHYEDPSQRYHSSLSQNLKTKSRTRLRNSNKSNPTKKVDFSGIELLAAAACSSFIQDNADYVDDQKVLKEDTTPGADSCAVDIKETLISTESDEAENKVALRLHWDLNTVMDEWEEPCDGLLVKSQPQENCSEDVKMKLEEGYESRCTEGVSVNQLPLIESCNDDSFEKTHESIEDLGIKTITSKTSDCESSVSKSDTQEETNVKGSDSDSDQQQAVCEEVIIEGGCESPKVLKSYCEKKGGSEDPCGSNSNVTEDEHEVEMEKAEEVGYDSPFEDGELRERVYYESDNTYKDKDKDKDELGSIENPLSEEVDHNGEGESSLLLADSVSVEESRKNVGRNYNSSNCRSWWDTNKSSSHEHNRPRNVGRDYYSYSPRDSGYRAHNRRRPSSSSSSSERNNGDDSYNHRAPNRYRFHSREEHHYHYHYNYLERERKVGCYSRSRSGSPIAWHFQKPKNLDVVTQRQRQRQRSLEFDQPRPHSSSSSRYTDKRHSDDHHNYKDKNGYTCTRK